MMSTASTLPIAGIGELSQIARGKNRNAPKRLIQRRYANLNAAIRARDVIGRIPLLVRSRNRESDGCTQKNIHRTDGVAGLLRNSKLLSCAMRLHSAA